MTIILRDILQQGGFHARIPLTELQEFTSFEANLSRNGTIGEGD